MLLRLLNAASTLSDEVLQAMPLGSEGLQQ